MNPSVMGRRRNITRWLLSFFLLSLLTFLSTCQQTNEENLPPIDQNEMIEIIVEALILEPAIREVPKSKKDSLGMQVYEQVLNKRGHSSDSFIESMQWLQAEPKKLIAVYEKVMEELAKKEATVDADKPAMK